MRAFIRATTLRENVLIQNNGVFYSVEFDILADRYKMKVQRFDSIDTTRFTEVVVPEETGRTLTGFVDDLYSTSPTLPKSDIMTLIMNGTRKVFGSYLDIFRTLPDN